MKKIITGYADVEEVGENGDKIMDNLSEYVMESLGARIELVEENVTPENIESKLYKVTLIVERVLP